MKGTLLWSGLCVAVGATLATTSIAAATGGAADDPSQAKIVTVPFNGSGDTCGFSNFFDPECNTDPDGGNDGWYAIQMAANETMAVKISLCGSSFDTVLWVIDEGLNEIACNDDSCSTQSELTVLLDGGDDGEIFSIAVDGFNPAACGAFVITIEEVESIDCPGGSTPEGEPCVDGGEDTTNGGCNNDVPVFSSIACGQTVCGSGWFDGATRDTDWYKLVLTEDQSVTWSGTADFSMLLGIVDTGGVDMCEDKMFFLGTDITAPGESGSVTRTLTAGTWYLFAAPDFDGGGVGCGANSVYFASVTCEDPPPPQEPCGDGVLTQSTDPKTITPVNSVTCNTGPPDFVNTDNGFARSFALTEDITVCGVQFGVEVNDGGDYDVMINLYTGNINGPFSGLTLRATTTFTVPDGGGGANYIAFFDPGVDFVSGENMIVEIFAPDRGTDVGGDGGSFFPGSNALGQTSPTYLRAADCGVTNYMTTGSIGFPDMHLVMKVFTGEDKAPSCPADFDDDGDVDFDDFTNLLANFGDPGCNGATPCPPDIDGDGDVDFDDFTNLLANFGDCP